MGEPSYPLLFWRVEWKQRKKEAVRIAKMIS